VITIKLPRPGQTIVLRVLPDVEFGSLRVRCVRTGQFEVGTGGPRAIDWEGPLGSDQVRMRIQYHLHHTVGGPNTVEVTT
jgi:hypothetical protein